MQRVDLIQDLRFETATTKIKATPDGEFLIAAGAFKVTFCRVWYVVLFSQSKGNSAQNVCLCVCSQNRVAKY